MATEQHVCRPYGNDTTPVATSLITDTTACGRGSPGQSADGQEGALAAILPTQQTRPARSRQSQTAHRPSSAGSQTRAPRIHGRSSTLRPSYKPLRPCHSSEQPSVPEDYQPNSVGTSTQEHILHAPPSPDYGASVAPAPPPPRCLASARSISSTAPQSSPPSATARPPSHRHSPCRPSCLRREKEEKRRTTHPPSRCSVPTVALLLLAPAK
ncbi:uncharacterized protein B0I36DRAFT_428849 [Microdochium trichocladiopsis]|uniref:Uncharacterized protein n=1 Tax=Microdochium trichocladiopsis TaxID=1682393 RepID=A0A9P8YIB3_9PEZI|nr:uncharacterized protein B0I36DRAFT_428849 [Microdochium trichocladiopsis]KAH7038469.1 hypothetical protein B0I36DRAFT_428849 [Microdochium trichocladiopsis]